MVPYKKQEYEINALTYGFWPFEKVESCMLPWELQEVKSTFEAFYQKEFNF